MLPVRQIFRKLSLCHTTICKTIPIQQLLLRALHVTGPCCKSKKKQFTESHSKDTESEINDVLKKAAKDVVDSLPGDAEKTATELLSQLRVHATSSPLIPDSEATSEKPVPSLGDLFSGMKIETGRTEDGIQRKSLRDRKSQNMEEYRGLFDGPRLGIFHAKKDKSKTDLQLAGETLWDKVDREELQKLTKTSPTNAFEELINLTEEGKLWHFPINNEQGMDEEAKYEFHDHIFFDDLLQDFPQKGPVRHFMELVTTGLSKNPYMTVPQKREHIDWFRNYFRDKQQILDDAMDSAKLQ